MEEHAVTFQKGNVQDLKEKLQQLIDSPEEVLKYKKTSQEFICEEGLDKILEEAGFSIRQPGCSACLAMNDDTIPAGKYSVSTSNRNFEGRQGPGARTLLARDRKSTRLNSSHRVRSRMPSSA